MTRTLISAGILCFLAAMSVFSCLWVNDRCGELLEGLDRVEYLAESGQTEEAVRTAQELEERWESFRRPASVLVRNNKLSELDKGYAVLEDVLAGEGDELDSALTELRHATGLLRDSETPSLITIL